jgi:ATP-dependent RNA helicase UAP56/SUB2
MSTHDNEELIDYEDDHDIVPNGATGTLATNGAATLAATRADGDGKDKKNFSGIHSTGFRYAYLVAMFFFFGSTT